MASEPEDYDVACLPSEMECCSECVTVRQNWPDIDNQEQAFQHIISHRQYPGEPRKSRSFG